MILKNPDNPYEYCSRDIHSHDNPDSPNDSGGVIPAGVRLRDLKSGEASERELRLVRLKLWLPFPLPLVPEVVISRTFSTKFTKFT